MSAGGKLGFVKDPFGKLGEPVFMGATLPLDGYGIINLGLSEDGQVLIGQLKGGFSANIFDGAQKDHMNLAWNVGTLLDAAIAMPEQDRLSKHIVLAASASQLIPVPTTASGYVAAPAGTKFDPIDVKVAYEGRMGDVLDVDLKTLIADWAARELLGWKNAQEFPESAMAGDERRILRDTRARWLQEGTGAEQFFLDVGQVASLTQDTPNGLKLVTKRVRDDIVRDEVLSRDESLNDAKFQDTGRMFLVPNITDPDETALRNGGRIATPKEANVTFHFRFKDAKGVWAWKEGQVKVTAKDVPRATTFFGDRPLDDPGYSAMTLKGEVKTGSTDKLDVYKVEQRLKYLGFPAMKTPSGHTIKNFKVDGTFATEETAALKLFEKVVRYAPAGSAARFAQISTGADGLIESGSTGEAKITKDWLNAWNAPHWVNVGHFATTRSANWANTQHEQDAGRRENWGTSWMGDWFVAQQYAPAGLRTNLQLLFNGATDANHAQTPIDHSSHDLGMAFDVGARPRPGNQQLGTNFPNAPIASDVTTAGNPATYQMQQAAGNAQPTGNQLSLPTGFTAGWNDANAQWFVRPDTRVQFPLAGNQNQTTNLRNANTVEGEDPSQPVSATNPAVYRLPTGQWQGNLRNDQRTLAAQILAMYSITNSSSSGYQTARMQLTGSVDDKETKAQYLFQGLFKSVLIGNSPTQYNNIRYVLNKLGVPLGNNGTGVYAGHEHHFHIAMGVPTRRDLPKNLEAQSLLKEQSMIDFSSETVPNVAQLWAQANVPSISRPSADWIGSNPVWRKNMEAAVSAANATQDLINRKVQYSDSGPLGIPTLKHERTVDYAPRPNSAGKLVPREESLGLASESCAIMDMLAGKAGAWGPECNITEFLQKPSGKLVPDTRPGTHQGDFLYSPSRAGVHTARFILENGAGQKIDVTVKIPALLDAGHGTYDGPNAPTFVADLGADDYAAWLQSANLSTLLATASKSLSGFADLPGSAVGNTVGEGSTASITLDTTAAGHGWYVDATPQDNTDDYLPTSNPNVWQAKAGSAAAGKMDMLSVLLHEYGHALGLEHSADARDFMATTLQPGERRMPSSEELALMSQLVAQLKADSTSTPTDPAAPSSPTSPLPGMPLAGLGLLALGRLRSDRYGTQTLFAPNGSVLAAVPQYDVAANATLTNGQFNAANNSTSSAPGWATKGSVSVATGSATLVETATQQTRLNQVFIVGPQDRYLSFTLSGIALDDAAAGPDDALEVALLNANTGASLLGSIALTHTDALLNLQAGGAELAASGVTFVPNLDGSRTYLVDLAGVNTNGAAGTAVNLSFDLIGFGTSAPNLGSHATVSRVRRLAEQPTPQTRDDSVTLAEDTVAQIIALANDVDANQQGMAPVVVTGPLHGQVVVNADGSFGYTPDANSFGADSFTYTVSDGSLTSNLATARITITPVNDAPVGNDLTATLAEDGSVVLNLLASASDMDGDLLTLSTGSAKSGSVVKNANGPYTYVQKMPADPTRWHWHSRPSGLGTPHPA